MKNLPAPKYIITQRLSMVKPNFSGISDIEDLYIGDVCHKAFVAVDEKGTEAAAATGASVMGGSMSLPLVNLKINRPFIFLIQDKITNSVLFLGRVLNPNG